MIRFDNSYARLPQHAFARLAPQPVPAPRLLAFNDALAGRLGLDAGWLHSDAGLAMLAGNVLPDGAEPLAQAYAGHQFGGFVPQLGDGRAMLIGEIIAPDGARFDIQLKGSGPTVFSRGGDGRAWLGPVLREYLVSEFMAAMNVPTTRALAAVSTGQPVLRETSRPGAVLTRIAASHIRVGTFQYFAVRDDCETLHALTRHAISRHYPQARTPMDLLSAVVSAQADTVARWMALGFIHGVMNTDNMTISGETIDYGPCAFMDRYHPDTVFSSIDRYGRYAWAEQPQVAVWNLAQLASCLVALMPDPDPAIEQATTIVHGFPQLYQDAWLRHFAAKLGIAAPRPDDRTLIEGLLTLMAQNGADFTATFADLDTDASRHFADTAGFARWHDDWRARVGALPDATSVMKQANPRRIPRNHRVEQAISAALEGDLAPFDRLLAACSAPHAECPDWTGLATPPRPEEEVRRTFCGT